MNQTKISNDIPLRRQIAVTATGVVLILVLTLLISSLGSGFSASAQEFPALTGTVSVQGGKPATGVSIAVTRISDEVRAETVAQGLEVPWALAFTPDGRILVTERRGRIRVIQNGGLLDAPLAVLDVARVSEAGLMGIALDPEFSANGHIYVCYTYQNGGGTLINRVARLTETGGVAGDHRVVLDGIPGARNHNGCRLRFGPDGKLYITMGDAGQRDNAQNLGSLSGKVLRINPDGSVPQDNPFPGSPIYTYGHRNPQGLDWRPVTGDLFITEHGPSQADEVNILRPGGNYGWPIALGQVGNPTYVDPILSFTPTLALAGGAFYTGGNLASSWQGNFIFANLKASHLHRVVLEPSPFASVISQERLFQGQFGRLRAAAMGPDGYLYFTTSNRDGRGSPMAGDDRVMRLVPAPGEAVEMGPPGSPDALSPLGSFTLRLPPGSHLIRWSLPGYLAVERRVDLPGAAGEAQYTPLKEIGLRAGDLNGDGGINGADLEMIRSAFGGAAGSSTGLDQIDLDGDGLVDVTDLALLASNWGLGR